MSFERDLGRREKGPSLGRVELLDESAVITRLKGSAYFGKLPYAEDEKGRKLYPTRQFSIGEDSSLSPHPVVVGVWGDIFEPAIQDQAINRSAAIEWMFGPDALGRIRADVLADRQHADFEGTINDAYQLIEGKIRELKAEAAEWEW